MGQKFTVESLPNDQYKFIVRLLLNGKTDREVEVEFEAEFPGERVPKSSFARWRKSIGGDIKNQYRLVRFLGETVAEELNASGIDLDPDRYKQVMEDINSSLLVKTHEIVTQDPMKLLAVRQEDEKLRIKREQIDLNRQKLDFEKQRHEKELAVRTDVLAIGAKAWQFMLYFMNENEPHVADAMTRRSSDILAGLEGYLLDEAA